MNILDQFSDTILTSAEERNLGSTDLVMANMHQAVLYARTCCGGKLQDDELVSLCYERLTKCAERWDPKRGTRFFAFCKPDVRGALLRYWSKNALVRNAETVALPEEKEEELVNHEVPTADPDFDMVDFRERWADVSETIAKTCTDRERAILHLVFSLNCTFEEAGAAFHVTRSAAQAIAAKVITRIKATL